MGSPVMADMPQIICTVRALHSFNSQQKSSLSFKKGELINVFSQLESGWWDGWCRGKRGWFPSNYVEIVSTYDEAKTKVDQPKSTPEKSPQRQRQQASKEKHGLQYTELDLDFLGTLGHTNGSIDGSSDNDDDQFEDATEMTNTNSASGSRPATEDRSTIQINEDSADVDQIISHWVKRTTPQGRVYYCNLLTQETTWDWNEIDPSTGRLLKSFPDKQDFGMQDASRQEQQADVGSENNVTWQTLSAEIALAIRRLSESTQSRQQHLFVNNTLAVVYAIRRLLHGAGLLENDSYHTSDTVLRKPHQMLMAALSKLILTSRIAADAKPLLHETLSRLQSDADNVLTAARIFVAACQQKKMDLNMAIPQFIHDDILKEEDTINAERKFSMKPTDGQQPQKSRYPLNQDLIVSLQTHANPIYNSIDALFSASTVQQPPADDPYNGQQQPFLGDHTAMVKAFRQLTHQLKQYMRLIEAMDAGHMESLQSSSVARFQADKQDLYDAFGHLFGIVQLVTPLDLATDRNGLDDALVLLQQSLEHLFVSIQNMVNERRIGLVRDNTKMLPNEELDEVSGSEDGTTTVRSMTSLPPATVMRHERKGSQQQSQPSSIGSTGRLGTQANVQSIFEERSSTDEAWFLGSDYQTTEIQFGKQGDVKAGTLRALVERLTLHDQLDTSFISTFLLTYRSFCTTEEFASLLEDRYHIRPPEGLTPENLAIWTEKKQKLIRLRVFSVIKQWLETYYNEEDKVVLDRLEFFITTAVRDSSEFSAKQLTRLIEMRRQVDADDRLKKLVPNITTGPPSVLPRPLTGNITLTDIDPLELARQLSIIDFKLYSSIRPLECLNKAWSREDSDIATHIKESIDHCNRLTSWVAFSILEHDDSKRRTAMIKFWAQVADRCRDLKNFNTCMAILSGFDNSAVARLRKTWEMVGGRTSQLLNQIRKLMGANRNFTAYRDMIHSVNPPCIPFLGIYLQDLTFIEDGNPDYLVKANHMINFAKRQKSAEVIQEIKQFQSSPYNLIPVQAIQQFIQTHLEQNYNVDTLYERSLKIEPREAGPSP